MENHHFKWENPLKIAIFNSYVSHYQREFSGGESKPTMMLSFAHIARPRV
jgi:hypothetical protein